MNLTAKYYSVSQLARELGIAPRTISDLFYRRKLDDAECPIVNRSRIIPKSYVQKIVVVLRETGAIEGAAA